MLQLRWLNCQDIQLQKSICRLRAQLNSFQSAVPPSSPRHSCFPHRKQRRPKVGPPRTRGHFTMLLDFSLPIEEVCGRSRTYLSVSGFALRITTAGRDGKTHKDTNRKCHVVLLPLFSRGIKGCGDILVLTVRQQTQAAQSRLDLFLLRHLLVNSLLPAWGLTELLPAPWGHLSCNS